MLLTDCTLNASPKRKITHFLLSLRLAVSVSVLQTKYANESDASFELDDSGRCPVEAS